MQSFCCIFPKKMSMWGVIAAVMLLFTLLYAGLLDFYRRHWLALAEWKVPAGYIPEVRISVIVAARNEVGPLQTCLDSLLVQDFPAGLSEILVVDDHSEDGTVAIARTKETQRLRVLELKDAPKAADGKAPFSKKKALEWGIAHAHGEFILTTDADCEVPPDWMRNMAFAFEEKGWDCVAGPVVFKERESLFQRFLTLDFLGMMLLTGGGYRGGLVHLANGASFGFSMKAYQAVGGYTDNMHIASGDDLFLLHKIMARGFKVGFMKTPTPVCTEVPTTFGEFVRQRLRWGTKSTAYKDWRLTAVLAIVFFHCWCILL